MNVQHLLETQRLPTPERDVLQLVLATTTFHFILPSNGIQPAKIQHPTKELATVREIDLSKVEK